MPWSRRALLAALGAAVAGCAGSPGAEPAPGSTTAPAVTTASPGASTSDGGAAAPGRVRWRLDAGAEPGALVVDGGASESGGADAVYYGADALYALAPDGSERWTFEVADDVGVRSVVLAGRVHVVTGRFAGPAGNGFALRAVEGGEERWAFATENRGRLVAPAVGADGVYVATADDYLRPAGETLYGLTPEGDERWTAEVGDPGSLVTLGGTVYASYPRHLAAFDPDGTTRWTADVAALSADVLAGSEEVVYAHAGDAVRAYAAADGSVRWTFPDAGPTVARGEYLYAVTRADAAVAVDPATGEAVWERPVAVGARGVSVLAAGGTVYVVGPTATALDGDGRVRWTRELPAAPHAAVATSGGVVVWSDGALRALDAADGAERWAFAPGAAAGHPHPRFLDADARNVYLATDGGTLYALRP